MVTSLLGRERLRKAIGKTPMREKSAIRILLIGEVSAARSQIEAALHEQLAGISVRALAPAIDVLSTIGDFDPDVILLHVDSARQLRQARWQELRSGEVPVVAIVERFDSESDPLYFETARRFGVRAWLTGSVRPTELAGAVQSVLAGLIVFSEDVVDLLQDHSAASPAASANASAGVADEGPEHITPREREVLEMMMEGLSNKEIASRLKVSTHTVKFHISSILSKLGATSRTEATTIGLRRGLITI